MAYEHRKERPIRRYMFSKNIFDRVFPINAYLLLMNYYRFWYYGKLDEKSLY